MFMGGGWNWHTTRKPHNNSVPSLLPQPTGEGRWIRDFWCRFSILGNTYEHCVWIWLRLMRLMLRCPSFGSVYLEVISAHICSTGTQNHTPHPGVYKPRIHFRICYIRCTRACCCPSNLLQSNGFFGSLSPNALLHYHRCISELDWRQLLLSCSCRVCVWVSVCSQFFLL